MPKARLGIALTELNRQRIYPKLAAGEGFAANEKQLLAKLLEYRPGDRPQRRGRDRGTARKRECGAPEAVGACARGDPPKSRDDMQELPFVREPAEIDGVAKRARVDRSDWSMAMEPGSLAFFDGILRGVSEGKSYYLKEDLIFEILSHLRDREPTFRKYFRAGERLRGLRLSVRSPR